MKIDIVKWYLHCENEVERENSPMYGRKLRIYYPGIDRACSNCYGMHARQRCRNEKVQWITYVRKFIEKTNQLIQPGMASGGTLWRMTIFYIENKHILI